MTSPRDMLEDLNSNNKYNYIYIPKGKNPNSIYLDIVKIKSQSTLPKPDHQIKGTLDEIHTLYLAIESYLRIEQMLVSDLGVYRVSDDYSQKLYKACPKPRRFNYSHFDQHLDLWYRDSLNGNEVADVLQTRTNELRTNVIKNERGVYTYHNTLKSKLKMSVSIGHIEKENMLEKIHVITKYTDSLGNEILQRCTDVYYTRGQLIFLRFALLDFLKYQLGFIYYFEIGRETPRGNYTIESRIQAHTALPELLIGN